MINYEPLYALDSQAFPDADQLAKRYKVYPNSHPISELERANILDNLRFGMHFTDHMVKAQWNSQTGWSGHQVCAYGPISLFPAASVFHYGQEIFEGIKAYRHCDGSIWTFRPGFNAARFRYSARRLALPELSDEEFLGALAALVRVDANWVPTGENESLYLRPFMFSSESFLGVKAGKIIDFMVIASPAGSYFRGNFEPVDIWVSQDYHRAAAGGTGAAKCGGNYAGSLVAQAEAHEKGFDQVLFLDAATNSQVEEIGGMNFFAVHANGTLITPVLNGNILEGGTRAAVLQLARDRGVKVQEVELSLQTLLEDIRTGQVVEAFACGTAAIIAPIGRIAGKDFDVLIGEPGKAGSITTKLHTDLLAIQYGKVPDPHNWMYRLY